MKLDDVLDEWERDCVIDTNHPDNSSIETAKLHAKYLRIFTDTKLRLAKTYTEYDILRRTKFRYFRGELTRDELNELGWDQWQFTRPLKAEAEELLKGDVDLAQLKTRIAYLETMVSSIESIMNQIKNRAWEIKNIISWRQFIAGG